MKNKLAALLAALLLCFSLLPAQALAASEPDPDMPLAVMDIGNPNMPEDSDKPGKFEDPISQCRVAGGTPHMPSDPNPDGREH